MTDSDMDQYLATVQAPAILRSLVTHLCVEKPERPVKFMIEYLQRHYLPAETERYHTEKYYGFKSSHPITYGVSASEGDAFGPKKRERERGGGSRSECLLDVMNVSHDDGKRQRRMAISDVPSVCQALDLDLFPPKAPEIVELLESVAASNLLFKNLERDERHLLFRAMFPVEYHKGETIIREGDLGDNYYIVEKGECSAFVKGVLQMTYNAGNSFGELALIHGTPRQATVVAVTDVTLWGLERTAYRATLMRFTTEKRAKYEEFLQKVPLLMSLARYERMLICDCLEDVVFGAGQTILRQGEVGHSFLLIVSGQVEVRQRVGDKEGVVGLLGPGDYFGEIALLTDQPRQATCIAIGTVKCASMRRDDFVRVMGPIRNFVEERIPLYKKFLGEPPLGVVG